MELEGTKSYQHVVYRDKLEIFALELVDVILLDCIDFDRSITNISTAYKQASYTKYYFLQQLLFHRIRILTLKGYMFASDLMNRVILGGKKLL